MSAAAPQGQSSCSVQGPSPSRRKALRWACRRSPASHSSTIAGRTRTAAQSGGHGTSSPSSASARAKASRSVSEEGRGVPSSETWSTRRPSRPRAAHSASLSGRPVARATPSTRACRPCPGQCSRQATRGLASSSRPLREASEVPKTSSPPSMALSRTARAEGAPSGLAVARVMASSPASSHHARSASRGSITTSLACHHRPPSSLGFCAMEVEIGRGKKARRAYGFDDVAIVPSRRTRDPDDVDVSWTLGPYRFELPLMASAMDGVVSPHTAGVLGKLGGLAVLNLEGLWTRYEDADAVLERIASLDREEATREMQEIYQEPVKQELIAQRIQEIKQQGVVAAASLTPQRVERYHELALDAGLDILVIQGTVISAEHVSTQGHVLNLKEFVAEVELPVVVGGCASYHTGLHLMRTGAAAVLVGVGPGAACTTRGVLGIGVPQATAIADVAAARSQHMLETGDYTKVIADGGMRNGGDVAKAIACGADAVMVGSPLARAYEAPGHGYHWGMATFHPTLPRGARVRTTQNGTLQEIVTGPARENDGTFNLMGALRTSMATCGYRDIAEFNRAELMVAPALQSEGKQLQRDQAVGMGARGGAMALAATE